MNDLLRSFVQICSEQIVLGQEKKWRDPLGGYGCGLGKRGWVKTDGSSRNKENWMDMKYICLRKIICF